MILYVCDTCKAKIQPSALKSGSALLVGDRAYCPACNPRTAAAPGDAEGHGRVTGRVLPCDGCQGQVLDRDLRSGRAIIHGGQILCPACLSPAPRGGGARHDGGRAAARVGVPGAPTHGGGGRPAGRDGVYIAGMIGLFILLPAVASLLTWRLTKEGTAEVAEAPGPASGATASRGAAGEAFLTDELQGMREENQRLLARVEELARQVSDGPRPQPAAPDAAARANDANSRELANRLEGLDRTIQRLEDSLLAKLSSAPAPAAGSEAARPAPDTGPSQLPAGGTPGAAAGARPPGDAFAALLTALAEGRIPPELDLGELVEDDDPSVRMLACKLAGMHATGAQLDRDLLRKLMRRMRDRDPEVQRAAMVACRELTGQRYITWDDLTAGDYSRIARIRELWDHVQAGDAARAGEQGATPGANR